MKHLKKFEAFVYANGELQELSKCISVNDGSFDLYNVDKQEDILYI